MDSTSTKFEANPFWGEQFSCGLSPEDSSLDLRLLASIATGSKGKVQSKRKQHRNQSRDSPLFLQSNQVQGVLVGTLSIELESLEPNLDHRIWYSFERPHNFRPHLNRSSSASGSSASSSSASQGSDRMEVNLWIRYELLHVLPARHYHDVAAYLFDLQSVAALYCLEHLPADDIRPFIEILTEIAALRVTL